MVAASIFATCAAAVHAGGRPVLTDTDPATFGTSPEEIEKRLKEMESKLLHGVDDLELRNKMLEEAAAKGQRDIEDRERAKAEREREIEKLEEAKLLKEEKFASKKEEAADKTRKLKKMFGKYQTADHIGRQALRDVSDGLWPRALADCGET